MRGVALVMMRNQPVFRRQFVDQAGHADQARIGVADETGQNAQSGAGGNQFADRGGIVAAHPDTVGVMGFEPA